MPGGMGALARLPRGVVKPASVAMGVGVFRLLCQGRKRVAFWLPRAWDAPLRMPRGIINFFIKLFFIKP